MDKETRKLPYGGLLSKQSVLEFLHVILNIIIICNERLNITNLLQMPYAEDVASFCKERQKPLMIAESTPFGGIVVGDVENEAGVTLIFIYSDLTEH